MGENAAPSLHARNWLVKTSFCHRLAGSKMAQCSIPFWLHFLVWIWSCWFANSDFKIVLHHNEMRWLMTSSWLWIQFLTPQVGGTRNQCRQWMRESCHPWLLLQLTTPPPSWNDSSWCTDFRCKETWHQWWPSLTEVQLEQSFVDLEKVGQFLCPIATTQKHDCDSQFVSNLQLHGCKFDVFFQIFFQQNIGLRPLQLRACKMVSVVAIALAATENAAVPHQNLRKSFIKLHRIQLRNSSTMFGQMLLLSALGSLQMTIFATDHNASLELCLLVALIILFHKTICQI